MGETVNLSGQLRIELRDPSGRVVERRVADNLITNAGRMFLAGLLGGHRQVQSLRIAVGTLNTDPRPEDTQLGQQVAAAPAALNEPNQRQEAGRTVVVAQVTATLPPLPTAEPQAIQEAGIQIIGPDGSAVLYNRVTFPVITRTGRLEMSLTWEVVF